MTIKKNTFATLVFKLFFPSIANCKKWKIQKSENSPCAPPYLMCTVQCTVGRRCNNNTWEKTSSV
jgi:hypothetical protein